MSFLFAGLILAKLNYMKYNNLGIVDLVVLGVLS